MSVKDLEPVIRTWAEKHLGRINGAQYRNTSSRNNNLEIDWSRVRSSTAYTTFSSSSSSSPRSSNGGSNVVFKSNYVNRTSEVQNHTFQMERSTDATVTTSVNKGFSKSGLVGIKIGVPDDVTNQTGSFGSEVTVETEDENVVKHQVSWGLNSTVKAPPNMKTVAELKITETEHRCNFEAEVHLRGRIIVRVHNGDSNNPQILENDLATILEDENVSGFSVQDRKVTCTVSGKLTFKFGVSQDVKVWSEHI